MFSSIAIKYESFFNRSIRLMDGTLTIITNSAQSGSGSNDNECLLHIHQISIAAASPSNAF